MEQLGFPDVAPAQPVIPARHRCHHCGAGFVASRSARRDRVAAQRRVRPVRDWAADWQREIEAHPADEITLERYALLLASKTTDKIRIAKVWEDMRSEVACNLDNGYRAAAARRMMQRHPALRGRFTTRETAGDPDRARRRR